MPNWKIQKQDTQLQIHVFASVPDKTKNVGIKLGR